MRCLLLAVAVLALPGWSAETVLVLPFFDQTKSENLGWIGESLAETVREALASSRLPVLDREDRVEAYKQLSLRSDVVLTRASVFKLAAARNASKVIWGDYELEPAPNSRGSLKITARLLDVGEMRRGPELQENGALEDLAALQEKLSRRVLQLLIPGKAPAQPARGRPALRVDALESYIRGLLAPSPEQKHRFFTQAARLEPEFSQPCLQLGLMYWEKKDYSVAAEWLERVASDDSRYFEARFLLGLSRLYTGDFAAAESSFRMVAAAAPVNEVINNLGAAQSRLNSPAALPQFRKALAGDSTDPDYHFNVGYALWKAGDFAAAADSFRATLERNQQDAEALSFLGRCLKKQGPRRGDPRTEGRERLKHAFEETAFRQLRAALPSGK